HVGVTGLFGGQGIHESLLVWMGGVRTREVYAVGWGRSFASAPPAVNRRAAVHLPKWTEAGQATRECHGALTVAFRAALIRSACSRWRRSCLVRISSPVPTVKRIIPINGFLKRIRLTSELPARCMNSRMARLVAWNRSSTVGGTWVPGLIFFGARQRRVLGDGSMTVRM